MQPSNPFIQRSAWKVFSANFGFTEFSEVRQEVYLDAARSDDAHRREGLYAC
jgi:hypothetical protein